MTLDRYHDFFAASASVAGALVGLLFVAVSVTVERMAERGETQVHRVRAAAALSAFSNALVISLFAVIPGQKLGWVAVAVSATGLSHLAASFLSLLRLRIRRPADLTDALFLAGLAGAYAIQMLAGVKLTGNESSNGATNTLAVLVIVCFVIGITRSWELIGGPSIAMGGELLALTRRRGMTSDDTSHTGQPAAGSGRDTPPGGPSGGSEGDPPEPSEGPSAPSGGGTAAG